MKRNILLAAWMLFPFAAFAQNDTLTNERERLITLNEAIAWHVPSQWMPL